MERYFLDNGKITTTATISIDHPALLNGDGIFTTMVVKNGRVDFFDLHMERLKKHAAFINLSFESPSKDLISSFIKKNKADTGFWKLKVLLLPDRPYLTLENRKPDRIIALLEPIQERKGPLSIISFSEEISGPLSRVKTLSYIERHYLLGEAKKQKFDEVLVSFNGFITEAAFANFFWIEKSTLCYPPKTSPYLFGITLSQIIEAARDIGLRIQEKKISVKDLHPEYLYFLSNALLGLCPVEKIDSILFLRDKELESDLRKAFEELCVKKALY